MAAKRLLLLLSSSRVHGYGYLEHAKEEIMKFLKKKNVTKVLFVPYAMPDHEAYTKTVSEALTPWGYTVEGIHSKDNPIDAVTSAEALFVGGGNTFVLLKTLYELNLIEVIREVTLSKGIPYIGSSAGTNVATRSINTTNDMPMAYPPTFDALNLVPFNINPHYLETDSNTEHRGETRDQRLEEFLVYFKRPVLGLREGTAVLVEGDKATLVGDRMAKLFRPHSEHFNKLMELDVDVFKNSFYASSNADEKLKIQAICKFFKEKGALIFKEYKFGSILDEVKNYIHELTPLITIVETSIDEQHTAYIWFEKETTSIAENFVLL